jgi:hypothetical protein
VVEIFPGEQPDFLNYSIKKHYSPLVVRNPNLGSAMPYKLAPQIKVVILPSFSEILRFPTTLY